MKLILDELTRIAQGEQGASRRLEVLVRAVLSLNDKINQENDELRKRIFLIRDMADFAIEGRDPISILDELIELVRPFADEPP